MSIWMTLQPGRGMRQSRVDLAAGVAADKDGQVGLGDHPVGAPAGVGAADTDGQGMVFGDGSLGVEGSGDRDVEHFGQLDYLGLGAGGGNAAARRR